MNDIMQMEDNEHLSRDKFKGYLSKLRMVNQQGGKQEPNFRI